MQTTFDKVHNPENTRYIQFELNRDNKIFQYERTNKLQKFGEYIMSSGMLFGALAMGVSIWKHRAIPIKSELAATAIAVIGISTYILAPTFEMQLDRCQILEVLETWNQDQTFGKRGEDEKALANWIDESKKDMNAFKQLVRYVNEDSSRRQFNSAMDHISKFVKYPELFQKVLAHAVTQKFLNDNGRFKVENKEGSWIFKDVEDQSKALFEMLREMCFSEKLTDTNQRDFTTFVLGLKVK